MSRSAIQVLQAEFHTARAKILELASFLDRLERAEGTVEKERQLDLIRQGIAALSEEGTDRAEKVQLLMSRDYDPNWRSNLNVDTRS